MICAVVYVRSWFRCLHDAVLHPGWKKTVLLIRERLSGRTAGARESCAVVVLVLHLEAERVRMCSRGQEESVLGRDS